MSTVKHDLKIIILECNQAIHALARGDNSGVVDYIENIQRNALRVQNYFDKLSETPTVTNPVPRATINGYNVY